LVTKLGHEVSQAAVVITELRGDLRDRTLFQEDGTEGFIATLLGLAGLAEEGFAESFVHGSTLRNVIALFCWAS
jgi:hypothetical protein